MNSLGSKAKEVKDILGKYKCIYYYIYYYLELSFNMLSKAGMAVVIQKGK